MLQKNAHYFFEEIKQEQLHESQNVQIYCTFQHFRQDIEVNHCQTNQQSRKDVQAAFRDTDE
jgi:hypothetical protein